MDDELLTNIRIVYIEKYIVSLFNTTSIIIEKYIASLFSTSSTMNEFDDVRCCQIQFS